MCYSRGHPFNCYTFCIFYFPSSILPFFLLDRTQKNISLMHFRKISNKVNQPITVESKRKFRLINLMTIQMIQFLSFLVNWVPTSFRPFCSERNSSPWDVFVSSSLVKRAEKHSRMLPENLPFEALSSIHAKTLKFLLNNIY